MTSIKNDPVSLAQQAADAIGEVVAERDALRAERDDLRDALIEWVDAYEELRKHPPDDTTKRWVKKLERVQQAVNTARRLTGYV
jgi:hypothetical protein